jgi:glutaconate CoA-transferase, subunit B
MLEGNNKELLKVYTPMEFAVCASAKYCVGEMNVFVGVGLSLLPSQLAQKLYAPEITIIYECGIIGSTAVGNKVPWGIDVACLQVNAECQTDIYSTLGWLAQTGRVDLTYLGAAQIDKYGNINTTLHGKNHTRPTARVSGSGGSHDLAVGSKHFIVIMNHRVDRIVEKLDYRTSPGFCEGGTSRWDVWGLSGGGPAAVYTNLAVLRPNPKSYEMEISEIYPFTSVEEVVKLTGYDIKVAADFRYTALPTDEEIKILREQLDVAGDYTGWKKLFKS